MRNDKYGQLVFNETDLCNLFLQNPDREIRGALTESPIVFDDSLSLHHVPTIYQHQESTGSVTEFDEKNQSEWFLPEEYKSIDIAQWILNQCNSEAELQRAGEELIMFQQRDMFMHLRYFKYLVDVMRKNNIVWGVGRGSSVASFVLFLIGIHKINSLYYDLSIDEFLK